MGKSNIEWTDETWNPVVGCSVLSAGCTNCYAMGQAARIVSMQPASHYAGLTKKVNGKHVWTGDVAMASEKVLTAPLRWTRPRMVFVNSMGDLFHESVTDAQIDKVFAIMALTPHHTYQILTKRPERMRDYFALRWNDRIRKRVTIAQSRIWQHMTGNTYPSHADCPVVPLPNVWLGVSIEDQRSADDRIKFLLDTPAALHFLSAEPLLGPVDLTSVAALRYPEEDDWSLELDWRFNCLEDGDCYFADDGAGVSDGPYREGRIRFVICGGESGKSARPMHPDWARQLRDQCAGTDEPTTFFFKQWGEWAPGENCPAVMKRSERAAWWWDSGWTYRGVTPSEGAHMHFDDAPDLYRIGKRKAGAFLDGKEHREMPQ